MKSAPVIAFAVLLVGGLLVHAVGAWWWFAVLAFAVGAGMRPRYPSAMLAAGAAAGALVYLVGVLLYGSGPGSLPDSIAQLFGLGSSLVLAAVVCLVGAVTAGLFALLGAYLRAVVWPAPSAQSGAVVR